MKRIIKCKLQEILKSDIFNNNHALILLENALISSGGEDFLESVDGDLQGLLEVLEIFDDKVEIKQDFWNSFHHESIYKRTGDLLKPKEHKEARDDIDVFARAVSGYFDFKYHFVQLGVTFVDKENRAILSLLKWRRVSTPLKEYSMEIFFNFITLNEIKTLLNEEQLYGVKSVEKRDGVELSHFISSDMLEIVLCNKIVERCLENGSKKII